jgi:uncharacterized protein (DUF433 family)
LTHTGGNWSRLSIAAALAFRWDGRRRRCYFQTRPGSYNDVALIGFLRALRRHFPGRHILLVWDGLGGHKSRVMRHYLAHQRSWLTVERLPGYAPETDGIDLFIHHLGDIVVASEGGLIILRELHQWFQAHLSRIEYDENKIALRLFPFTRASGHTDEQPRFIVIDPRVSFGRPIIDGTGIPTTAIYERYLAGDSPEHLAKDYERDLAEIHEAIRCESQ